MASESVCKSSLKIARTCQRQQLKCLKKPKNEPESEYEAKNDQIQEQFSEVSLSGGKLS